jgi:glycosyltransferase involved in cell wall biosynthesis
MYNMEAYIKRCLISISKQTYENLEIIIVDDGSSDNSLEICKVFAEKDNRLKIIHQTNQGVSSARNTGISNATGDYIAFVDSDDYIHPEMYERLYLLLKNNDADISGCFIRGCWDSDYVEPPRNDIHIEVFNKIGALKTVFDSKYEIDGTGVVVTNKLYKRSIFNKIRFNTEYITGEDEQIICYIMKNVEKFVITDERLYYYFNRSDSAVHKEITEDRKIKHHIGLLNMYDERLKLFKEEEYNEIYKTCFINMMNLIISAFFSVNNIDFKKNLVQTYRTLFNGEFKDIVQNHLTFKDRVRFLIFRIYPQLYNIILIRAQKRSLG